MFMRILFATICIGCRTTLSSFVASRLNWVEQYHQCRNILRAKMRWPSQNPNDGYVTTFTEEIMSQKEVKRPCLINNRQKTKKNSQPRSMREGEEPTRNSHPPPTTHHHRTLAKLTWKKKKEDSSFRMLCRQICTKLAISISKLKKTKR